MTYAPEPDSGVRTWLTSSAQRPASWAAAAMVVGGLMGATATLLITLPPGFRTIEVSLDLFFGLVRSSRLLTALGLGGVCALLVGRAPHLLIAISGAFAALLSLATLVWFVAQGPFVASLSAEQVRGEPRLLMYATIAAYWGRVVLVVFFVVALLWARRWLAVLLLFVLGFLEVPSLGPLLSFLPAEWPVLLLGFSPFGSGLVGAACWTLLGIVVFRSGQQLEEEKRRATVEENRRKARRLYEEAFGAGHLSVVSELVASDFFDHRRRRRGPEGFTRTVTDLRHTFPDLSLTVEEQAAEGDTVTTKCVLSGTDRGGVLWYPPTNRSVSFSATYADRFSEGKLVEHHERSDVRVLLEKLGLPAGD